MVLNTEQVLVNMVLYDTADITIYKRYYFFY